MLKTLTFHCFLLTLTLLLPVTKPEVECISIDQRVRWQNQLCDLYCIWIFMCPKEHFQVWAHPIPTLNWCDWGCFRRGGTTMVTSLTVAQECHDSAVFPHHSWRKLVMTWAAYAVFFPWRSEASRNLHEIGVTLGQTRSNSKGMKAWHVRKLRTTWHVAAVVIHDFFKIHRLNRASLESTWFQSESPLASSFVHFVRFDSRLTFWVYQVLTDFLPRRDGLKGGCFLSLSFKISTFTQSMAG